MRLVICDGIQYDADNLPAYVDASKCVPADQWFRENRVTGKDRVKVEPPKVDEAPKKRRTRRTRKA